MINISEIYDHKKNIKKVTISGHANSKKHNEKYDLVCAGVSSIVYGIINSLNENDVKINIDNGFVEILIKRNTIESKIILNVLHTSLKTIEENNKKYINITILKERNEI